MVSTAIDTSVSGLRAQAKAVQNAAHNIANRTNDKADLLDTEFASQVPGGVSVKTTERPADDNGLAQHDDIKDVTTLITSENAFAANAKVIKTADKMLGSLLDIIS